MDDENNRPESRVSRSFIFSIIFVAAIVALIAYLIFSNMNSATEITRAQLVNYLATGKVNDVQLRRQV